MRPYAALSALLLFAAFVLTVRAKAPQTKPLDPRLIGFLYFLDEQKGALEPLEREVASTRFSTRALGYAGGKSTIEVRGSKSPVRFRAGRMFEFVINGVAPDLYKFKAKKDKRVAQVASIGVMGSSRKSGYAEILCDVTRYGNSVRIVPAQTLTAGEYCFYSDNQAFCFGVDSSPPN